MQTLFLFLCILSFPADKKDSPKEDNIIMRLYVICEDYKQGSLIINDYGEFKLKNDIEVKIKDDPGFLIDTLGEPIEVKDIIFPCYLELELKLPYIIEDVTEILDKTQEVLRIKYVEQVDLIKIKEEKNKK